MTLRLTCCFALALSASAANISFQGTFATDDQVQLFDFALSSEATVTMVSLAYGGGINAAGIAIPSGGFDSFFSLFAADGTQIDTNDDGAPGQVNLGNGGYLDAFLSDDLGPGTYTLALTESGNEPVGDLSDGFTEQGQGNFTCQQGFCDEFGDQQNGTWAVDILNVTSAATPGSSTPEPMTFPLMGTSLLLAGLAKRRKT
jgi:hypothetical protein